MVRHRRRLGLGPALRHPSGSAAQHSRRAHRQARSCRSSRCHFLGRRDRGAHARRGVAVRARGFSARGFVRIGEGCRRSRRVGCRASDRRAAGSKRERAHLPPGRERAVAAGGVLRARLVRPAAKHRADSRRGVLPLPADALRGGLLRGFPPRAVAGGGAVLRADRRSPRPPLARLLPRGRHRHPGAFGGRGRPRCRPPVHGLAPCAAVRRDPGRLRRRAFDARQRRLDSGRSADPQWLVAGSGSEHGKPRRGREPCRRSTSRNGRPRAREARAIPGAASHAPRQRPPDSAHHSHRSGAPPRGDLPLLAALLPRVHAGRRLPPALARAVRDHGLLWRAGALRRLS